jgi:hypothetical protein
LALIGKNFSVQELSAQIRSLLLVLIRSFCFTFRSPFIASFPALLEPRKRHGMDSYDLGKLGVGGRIERTLSLLGSFMFVI